MSMWVWVTKMARERERDPEYLTNMQWAMMMIYRHKRIFIPPNYSTWVRHDTRVSIVLMSMCVWVWVTKRARGRERDPGYLTNMQWAMMMIYQHERILIPPNYSTNFPNFCSRTEIKFDRVEDINKPSIKQRQREKQTHRHEERNNPKLKNRERTKLIFKSKKLTNMRKYKNSSKGAGSYFHFVHLNHFFIN